MSDITKALRVMLLDRAKYNSWFGANGKLTKRGRDGCIDFLVGAAATAEALGDKQAYKAISMQAFMCASGRADEFLKEPA